MNAIVRMLRDDPGFGRSVLAAVFLAMVTVAALAVLLKVPAAYSAYYHAVGRSLGAS